MPKSLLIPSDDDLTIELSFPGTDQPSKAVDILDLEDIFVTSSKLAKEQQVEWKMVAPKKLKAKLGIEVTPTQAALIYGALQAQIMDVKKKLVLVSEHSTQQDV